MVRITGELIIAAATSGDLNYIGRLKSQFEEEPLALRRICDACSDFSTGRNALHHAARAGNVDICIYLIDEIRVFIDTRSYDGDSALIEAAKGGHIEVIECLTNRGANLSEENFDGLTALHYSVLRNDEDLMKWLLEKNVYTEFDSIYGTPLQCAASLGNINAVKALLDNGAKPSTHFSNLASPLACAVKSDSFECFDLILGHVKPIEEAALANNLDGVQTLFRETEQLQHL